jgi:hypothetical protein
MRWLILFVLVAVLTALLFGYRAKRVPLPPPASATLHRTSLLVTVSPRTASHDNRPLPISLSVNGRVIPGLSDPAASLLYDFRSQGAPFWIDLHLPAQTKVALLDAEHITINSNQIVRVSVNPDADPPTAVLSPAASTEPVPSDSLTRYTYEPGMTYLGMKSLEEAAQSP